MYSMYLSFSRARAWGFLGQGTFFANSSMALRTWCCGHNVFFSLSWGGPKFSPGYRMVSSALLDVASHTNQVNSKHVKKSKH